MTYALRLRDEWRSQVGGLVSAALDSALTQSISGLEALSS